MEFTFIIELATHKRVAFIAYWTTLYDVMCGVKFMWKMNETQMKYILAMDTSSQFTRVQHAMDVCIFACVCVLGVNKVQIQKSMLHKIRLRLCAPISFNTLLCFMVATAKSLSAFNSLYDII